ncbi:MAG: DNA/RNA nuclease SfsA [Parvularculaceae bacterium]
MRFPSPLQRCVLERRYKRFLADVAFEDGSRATAHCPNPGSMMGVAPANAPAWVSTSASKTRKLPLTLELVDVDGGLVAINTNNPNKIAAEAIAAGRVAELPADATLRREVPYGASSRIDILLEADDGAQTFVEVKNVHLMREAGLAEFPDSVTARGAKHLRELAAVAAAGARAVMFFVVQRSDCVRFRPAADLDPTYARTLAEAANAGVELICYDCEISTEDITLRRPLAIEL